ncbi:MAG: sensor histidine kinase [Actinomycetes bacterium]
MPPLTPPQLLHLSVRARTTLLASAIVAVALLLSAVALLFLLRHELIRSADQAAETRAGDIARLAEGGALSGEVTPSSEDDIVQVVDADGTVVAGTPRATDKALIATFTPPAGKPVVRDVMDLPSDDGEREDFRVWALTTETADGPVTVYVGTSLEQISETLATVQALLALGLPALLGLLAFGSWIVVGRALRPMEAIRAEVADISDKALSRRVPVPATTDEVSRLAESMNDMLDRLEEASDRQRAFVADASHELQSPLASLRTQLEVALTHPSRTDWDLTARDMLEDTGNMERLVRDLLFLARSDASEIGPRRDPVDLDDVVLDEAARLRTDARVTVDTSGVSAAPLNGSRDELSRMVRNLLENAREHATSSVTVQLRTYDGAAELVVEDDGPGVPPEDRGRIFDRFVRADEARSRHSGGTGLGLAIAAAIASRHGGSVSLLDSTRGARFSVHLPVGPGPGVPEPGSRALRRPSAEPAQPEAVGHHEQ